MFIEHIRKQVPNLDSWHLHIKLFEKNQLVKSSRALLTPSKTGFFISICYILRSLGQGFTKPVFRRTLDSFLEGTNIWFSFDIRDLDSKDSICVWSSWKKKIWLVNGLPNMWSKESMNSRQMKTDILFSDFPQVYYNQTGYKFIVSSNSSNKNLLAAFHWSLRIWVV